MAHRLHRNNRSMTSAEQLRRHVPQPSKKERKLLFKKEQNEFNANKKHNSLYSNTSVLSPTTTIDSNDGPGSNEEANSDEEDTDDDNLPGMKNSFTAAKVMSTNDDAASLAGYEDFDGELSEKETNMTEGDDFDVAEDDDNYDGLDDQMSEVSEDSANFEAEVEREILAEGENSIDWDAENIFGYTGPWQESQYFLQEMATSDALFDIDYLALDTVEPAAPTSQEPVMGHPVVEFHTRSWSPDIAWSASGSSVSGEEAEARPGSESPSRRTSQVTGASDVSSFPLRIDPGEETDQEEPPVATISTPSVTLSRQSSRCTPSSGLRSKIIDHTTPRRAGTSGPVKRKMKVKPNKPIAYYVNGSSVMVFKTPKGSKLKWIDMRRFNDSVESSGPSSPTMIDLDAALREGNQRTGAAITDVIYGQMFRQYHCTRFDLNVVPQPSSHAEFARVPALNGAAPRGTFSLGDFDLFSDSTQDTSDNLQTDAGLMELIDFDGGVEHSESFSGDEDNAGMPATDDVEMDDSLTPNLKHNSDLPTTSTVDDDATPKESKQNNMDKSSSPLKRRARRSASPAHSKRLRNNHVA